MRKALCAFVILLLGAVSLRAQGVSSQGQAYSYLSSNSQHNVNYIPNATIIVCQGSTLPLAGFPCSGSLASLFQNAALTIPLLNPFNSDANGNFTFWAAPGFYVVSIAGTGFTTFSYPITLGLPSGTFTCPVSITSGAFSNQLACTTTAARTWTLQDTSDTFVYRSTTDTLANKTISLASNTLNTTTNTAGHVPRNNGAQYLDAQLNLLDLNVTSSGQISLTGNNVSIVPGTNGQCLITSSGATVWGSCAGTAGVQLIGTPNTTQNAVSTSTTNFQPFQQACATAPCFAAGALNSIGKTFEVEAEGFIQFNSPSQTFGIVTNIGGTTTTLGTPFTTTPTSGAGASFWSSKAICTVTTTGASGAVFCMFRYFYDDVNGINTSAKSGSATITGVNLTGVLSPTVGVYFSTASTNNIGTQNYALTRQDN